MIPFPCLETENFYSYERLKRFCENNEWKYLNMWTRQSGV